MQFEKFRRQQKEKEDDIKRADAEAGREINAEKDTNSYLTKIQGLIKNESDKVKKAALEKTEKELKAKVVEIGKRKAAAVKRSGDLKNAKTAAEEARKKKAMDEDNAKKAMAEKQALVNRERGIREAQGRMAQLKKNKESNAAKLKEI